MSYKNTKLSNNMLIEQKRKLLINIIKQFRKDTGCDVTKIDKDIDSIFDFNIVKDCKTFKGMPYSSLYNFINVAKQEFLERIFKDSSIWDSSSKQLKYHDYLTRNIEQCVHDYVATFVVELWKAYNEES